MRRRLMVALVGLVAGVLLIAGAGSLVLTRNSARQQATQQLVAEATSLTSGTAKTESLVVLRTIQRVLNLEDARVVSIDAQGQVTSVLPAGVTAGDLNAGPLLDGQTISGRIGSLVYAAAPVTLAAQDRTRLRLKGQLAILLTRQVGDLGPSWGYFIIAGGVTLLVAALVAWQMSRRMSRPLIEAMQVTGQIASGDLQSRVSVRERDYAEFSSLAQSINVMARSLADARSRERQLLLSVSHDLRTPLTSIRGFAEAIQDGTIDDNSEAASVIIAESRRLERLVGDLLDLAKLETKQLSMQIRPTNGSEVVTMAVNGFRPVADRTGLRLAVNVADQPAVALAADSDRLAQLMANLIENALTYARTTVSVSLSDAGDPEHPAGQTIVVEDDGPGIAPADLPRVFERFYQADRGPNRQIGSGLGLAIVAEIATAMGAAVRAESPINANGGSRFIVTVSAWTGAPSCPEPSGPGRDGDPLV
ncbi:MAG TPA: HAMP domain-containing sensor histidine kinase [Acidimicrobiales bacterium]|jgi:two-component system sensor histidine kinase BaeS|nr:HAMP domain-containing sensor histidine kinase [Acidimicrobiales bacterium]